MLATRSTLLAACLVLLTVALLAVYVPVRHAARIDPVRTLRGD